MPATSHQCGSLAARGRTDASQRLSADFFDKRRVGVPLGRAQRLSSLMVLLQVTLEPRTGGDMIVVHGDLDDETVDELRERLELAHAARSPALAIDLRGCLAIEDGSLKQMIETAQRLADSGVSLAFIAGHPQVRQGLREAGLNHAIALCWTREAAIAVLDGQGAGADSKRT